MKFKLKGQMQGQVLIYILTVIIAGLIFGFGYKAIKGFTGDIESSKLLDFEIETKKIFSKISTEYQSLEKHTFILPSDYEQVCFANLDELLLPDGTWAPDGLSHPAFLDKYPLIVDSIESGIRDNLFVYSTWLEKTLNVGKIKIKHETFENLPFICYPLFQGKLYLEIRGLGNAAQIQEDDSQIS